MVTIAVGISGCGDWHGLNSLPMPGTAGRGPGSFMIQAELPDVNNIQPNSRVRVGDVNVGTLTKIERAGWHALVTMRINGDVTLPENSTAKIGPDQPAGIPAHRIGPAERCTAARADCTTAR